MLHFTKSINFFHQLCESINAHGRTSYISTSSKFQSILDLREGTSIAQFCKNHLCTDQLHYYNRKVLTKRLLNTLVSKLQDCTLQKNDITTNNKNSPNNSIKLCEDFHYFTFAFNVIVSFIIICLFYYLILQIITEKCSQSSIKSKIRNTQNNIYATSQENLKLNNTSVTASNVTQHSSENIQETSESTDPDIDMFTLTNIESVNQHSFHLD